MRRRHCAGDQFAAHAFELGRRRFEVALDLLQREAVIGALVPIALAIDRMKDKADAFGSLAPVRPLVAGNAPHG